MGEKYSRRQNDLLLILTGVNRTNKKNELPSGDSNPNIYRSKNKSKNPTWPTSLHRCVSKKQPAGGLESEGWKKKKKNLIFQHSVFFRLNKREAKHQFMLVADMRSRSDDQWIQCNRVSLEVWQVELRLIHSLFFLHPIVIYRLIKLAGWLVPLEVTTASLVWRLSY